MSALAHPSYSCCSLLTGGLASLPTDSQRKIAEKFYPYLDFELAEATRAAASERQLRLLGWHGISNYG